MPTVEWQLREDSGNVDFEPAFNKASTSNRSSGAAQQQIAEHIPASGLAAAAVDLAVTLPLH